MLALLEMLPTGFGSPVVSVPILSSLSRQAPGPDREEQVTYAQHKVPFSAPGRATLIPLPI